MNSVNREIDHLSFPIVFEWKFYPSFIPLLSLSTQIMFPTSWVRLWHDAEVHFAKRLGPR
jgi:hypothetical protein